MKRKVLLSLLSFALILALAGCGAQKAPDPIQITEPTQASEEAQTTEAAHAQTTDPVPTTPEAELDPTTPTQPTKTSSNDFYQDGIFQLSKFMATYKFFAPEGEATQDISVWQDSTKENTAAWHLFFENAGGVRVSLDTTENGDFVTIQIHKYKVWYNLTIDDSVSHSVYTNFDHVALSPEALRVIIATMQSSDDWKNSETACPFAGVDVTHSVISDDLSINEANHND